MDNAVGSRAAARRRHGRGRGRGGRGGRASVDGQKNQVGGSHGPLLHSDAVNPARSPARSPHPRQLGSLQHAAVHSGHRTELRSPAAIARGVEAMNELSGNELYREVAWSAARGAERPELQRQLEVIASTAELLAERRAGTVQQDQAGRNGVAGIRTASRTVVQEDQDEENGAAGVHTARRTIVEEDAGPLMASASQASASSEEASANGEDAEASHASDPSTKRRRVVHSGGGVHPD